MKFNNNKSHFILHHYNGVSVIRRSFLFISEYVHRHIVSTEKLIDIWIGTFLFWI